jgi:predicted nucleotide-binding protein
VFAASHFPIEDLETQVGNSDFAVLVLSPDDQVITARGTTGLAPRDNLILELGIFIGG